MADEQQDWRLKVELDASVDAGGGVSHLFGHLRGGVGGGNPDVAHELESAVPHDVVLTHDGKLLFAYAADEEALAATRRAIEGVLARENMRGRIFVSHWDDELDSWRQTDPPPSAAEVQKAAASERDGETVETRTLVASSGKSVRGTLEQSMLEWAEQLGVQCTIIEHPHLLTTQVGFTITGPRHKLDEFSAGLKAEETTTIRSENSVILSQF
jgi:hypothetical protein